MLRRTPGWMMFLLLVLPAGGVAASEWVALSWHDVRDEAEGMTLGDPFAVSTERLAEQFEWLRANGWQPVSLDQLLAARDGRATLPEQAVLLTFDDGLESLYSRVFPLLRAYGYPAVAAVVTGWLEGVTEGATVLYEGRPRGRDGFVDWAALREMADSGLVEIASHSHDLHRGVLGNPQGNEQPAATTREYLPAAARYETEAERQARIRADLARSADLLERHTGQRPRAVVWPYGEYDATAESIAAELGMEVSLGLTTGRNGTHRLHGLHRLLITGNPDLALFATLLPQAPRPAVQRIAHVDLDYVFDADPTQQARNLDALLDRIKALGITTVYLQAFADPDGDGTADALYFPNRHLPVRADLFNRVAWQLRTRARVEVYAWMPMLAFDLPDAARGERLAVLRPGADGRPEPARLDYRRLSPFLPEARTLIGEIYADLARHAHFAGLLFHDDAYLAADEDLAACSAGASWPGSGRPIDDCELAPAEKTAALIDFGAELVEGVRRYRPAVRTARNLYPRVVLDPASEARFSQSLPAFLAAYDHTALMAMPGLDGEDPADEAWLRTLLHRVAAEPRGLERTVFKLQAKDWQRDAWLPAELLRDQFRLLVRAGAVHLAYYPDDFIGGRPGFEDLFQGISNRSFPYREAE